MQINGFTSSSRSVSAGCPELLLQDLQILLTARSTSMHRVQLWLQSPRTRQGPSKGPGTVVAARSCQPVCLTSRYSELNELTWSTAGPTTRPAAERILPPSAKRHLPPPIDTRRPAASRAGAAGSLAPGPHAPGSVLHPSADLLGVNELHGGRYRSLLQLAGLLVSYVVGAGRRGCCTQLLYCLPGSLRLMSPYASCQMDELRWLWLNCRDAGGLSTAWRVVS